MSKVLLWVLGVVGILAMGGGPLMAQVEPAPTAEELTLRPGDTISWAPASPHHVRFGGTVTHKGAQLPLTTFATVENLIEITPKLTPDANGIALGGIRLAEAAVPTAVNNGTNTGPGACARWGYYKAFDVAMLNKLYPTHAAYVSAVEKVTNENLKAGFILKADADATIKEARDSAIGRLDSLEAERDRPLSDFDRAP